MSAIVISQPMYFPWVGLFEQLRQADVFVHYDDVQFSKGSFTNRVQMKTEQGSRWLTIPLRDLRFGQSIRDVRIDNRQNWQERQRAQFCQAYRYAPFVPDAIDIMDRVFASGSDNLAEVLIDGFEAIASYFGLLHGRTLVRSSQLGIEGASSDRVIRIVERLSGQTYVTGHGAKNYLDHEAFHARGIEVRYIDYRKLPYPQLHGGFTPFVTALDLVANVGRAGSEVISSPTVNWKEFIGNE